MFLKRLNTAFNSSKTPKASFYLPIREIQYITGSLTVILPTITQNKDGSFIKFQIFICPVEFKLIGKLEFRKIYL